MTAILIAAFAAGLVATANPCGFAKWREVTETPSTATRLGIDYVDLPIAHQQMTPIRFTFR